MWSQSVQGFKKRSRDMEPTGMILMHWMRLSLCYEQQLSKTGYWSSSTSRSGWGYGLFQTSREFGTSQPLATVNWLLQLEWIQLFRFTWLWLWLSVQLIQLSMKQYERLRFFFLYQWMYFIAQGILLLFIFMSLVCLFLWWLGWTSLRRKLWTLLYLHRVGKERNNFTKCYVAFMIQGSNGKKDLVLWKEWAFCSFHVCMHSHSSAWFITGWMALWN